MPSRAQFLIDPFLFSAQTTLWQASTVLIRQKWPNWRLCWKRKKYRELRSTSSSYRRQRRTPSWLRFAMNSSTGLSRAKFTSAVFYAITPPHNYPFFKLLFELDVKLLVNLKSIFAFPFSKLRIMFVYFHPTCQPQWNKMNKIIKEAFKSCKRKTFIVLSLKPLQGLEGKPSPASPCHPASCLRSSASCSLWRGSTWRELCRCHRISSNVCREFSSDLASRFSSTSI